MKIEALIETGSKNIDKTFTYSVPKSLEKEIAIGKRVTIPFGNRTIEGFILEINDKSTNYRLKDIINVIDKNPPLNQEMIELAEFMINKYMALKTYTYQTLLPKALRAKHDNNIKKKYITYLISDQKNNKLQEYIKLNKKNKKQIELLEEIINNKKALKTKYSSSTVKALIDKKIIKETKEEKYRYEIKSEDENQKKKLTKEQQNAFNKIKTEFNTPQTILIHGVTGSGKTELYMHLIDEVIKENKEAIVLVPEISLTEQMINRFVNRYKDEVAVLHSGLSDGEKYDEWRKIKRKEVKIVIGARSAIFAPFTNLGIIIIDEEHEHTYKSENNPKYHARDVAIWRGQYHNCPTILGSATPSLESYARAKKEIYKLIELKNRIGSANLPKVEIITMSDEYKTGNRSIFSKRLSDLIKEKIEKKNK